MEHRGRRLAFSQLLSPNREETPEMAAEGAGILGVVALEVPSGQGRGLPPSHWVKAENFIRRREPRGSHCLLWTFVKRGPQGKEVAELQMFLSFTFASSA